MGVNIYFGEQCQEGKMLTVEGHVQVFDKMNLLIEKASEAY